MSVLGKIIDLDVKHGYGFIEDENCNDKVFFHVRDMRATSIDVHVNELVEFDVESDLNGCRIALNISPTVMK
ncbi:cold-shock protein [Vibrio sinaloensis]|uniref:cold-shock protein n=1 Tax=Vibrio TaxID=662 RepID=UPI0022AFEBF4|nr:cold shock domain-containing protein [Vibrio sinaloensis]MCZ4293267.1 cold shock domain-containing protein [Vibrio sinaloensis]